jgi:hypothetical protein
MNSNYFPVIVHIKKSLKQGQFPAQNLIFAHSNAIGALLRQISIPRQIFSSIFELDNLLFSFFRHSSPSIRSSLFATHCLISALLYSTVSALITLYPLFFFLLSYSSPYIRSSLFLSFAFYQLFFIHSLIATHPFNHLSFNSSPFDNHPTHGFLFFRGQFCQLL